MNKRLDEVTAQAILDRVAAGEQQRDLAAEFKVSPSAISNLVGGKSWPNLRRAPQPTSAKHRTKLSPADITVILRRLQTGEKPGLIARDYGVTRQAIANIKKGKSWGEVPRPEVVVSRPARRKVWESGV